MTKMRLSFHETSPAFNRRSFGTRAGLALVLAAACLACISPARAGDGPAASTGCGSTPPIAAGTSQAASLKSGGIDREYRIHLPTAYAADEPAPLVLVIHGYTGLAEQTENAYTSFRPHGDEHGYITVFPQGTGFRAGDAWVTSWNDGACNASPGPAGPICTDGADDYPTPPECGSPRECDWCSCHDDVQFISELLDELEEKYCIDRNRVFATGISNGGMFVHRLGCELPHRFAAIAPVAGTLARGFNCAPSGDPPISMMNIYATADDTVPFDGSPASDGFLYTPTRDVMELWASVASQGCAGADSPYPTSRDGFSGFRCIQRADCASGAELVDCAWDGGHDWPRKDGAEFASPVIWEFFEKNSR